MKPRLMYIRAIIVVIVTVVSEVTCAAERAQFQRHNGLRDVFCTDHSENVGYLQTRLYCGQSCATAPSCRGFFYNSATGACSLVRIISIPYSGCNSQAGSDYYIMLVDDVFGCYHWTDEDTIRTTTEPERSVCKSHKYNMYHTDLGDLGTSAAQYGCQGCWCCSTRGCHSGAPQLYGGKWHSTASGINCQRWDQQLPHEHNNVQGTFAPGETYVDANNYCRDPNNSGGV